MSSSEENLCDTCFGPADPPAIRPYCGETTCQTQNKLCAPCRERILQMNGQFGSRCPYCSASLVENDAAPATTDIPVAESMSAINWGYAGTDTYDDIEVTLPATHVLRMQVAGHDSSYRWGFWSHDEAQEMLEDLHTITTIVEWSGSIEPANPDTADYADSPPDEFLMELDAALRVPRTLLQWCEDNDFKGSESNYFAVNNSFSGQQESPQWAFHDTVERHRPGVSETRFTWLPKLLPMTVVDYIRAFRLLYASNAIDLEITDSVWIIKTYNGEYTHYAQPMPLLAPPARKRKAETDLNERPKKRQRRHSY